MLTKILNDSDVKAFGDLLAGASDIVLTCHVRPDGDAIGSTLGLCHLLRSLGKQAHVVIPDQAPRSLAFLPGFGDMVAYSKYPDYAERLLSETELLICCDFNKPSRQDGLCGPVQAAGCPKVLIDHHQQPDDFAQVMFSYPDMSSTCELAFRIIAALGLYSRMNKDSATCLCTGLVTDTRNFTVNCPNPEIYEVLMRLLEKGVDKHRIVKEALETKSLDSIRLQAYALYEKLEIFPEHQAAVVTLGRDELERFSYERGDSEGLVNKPLEIPGITYSFFLREDSDCIKVSARSVNHFPVSRICEDLYGGGGHVMASGGEFRGTLDECRRILVDSMPRYDRFLKTGADSVAK